MPCRDYGPDPTHEMTELVKVRSMMKEQKKTIDTYARLLCFVCEYLPADELEKLFLVVPDEEHGNAGPELKSWWKTHQEFDRQRKEKEAQERAEKAAKRAEEIRKAEVKKSALRKLTSEERQLLGLS